MTNIPLKNQIIQWLKDYQYWFQYAGKEFLEGKKLSEDLINQAYQFFLEDAGLTAPKSARPEIAFNEDVAITAVETAKLQLLQIKEIENVNALAPDQHIEIHPNLTIIYGANGVGKSGYVRLLNNAFRSRGDREILPNVFSGTAAGNPACNFVFKSSADPYPLRYPDDKDRPEFSQFTVFDNKCVRVQLEEENNLIFTPGGFEFFNEAIALFDALKAKLQEEINKSRPKNEFINLFQNENIIRKLIISLGASSDLDEIKKIGCYTEKDSNQFESLNSKRAELQTLNIPQKISDFQKLQDQLTSFITNLTSILENLSADDIDNYASLINSFNKFQELSKQEGIKCLEAYNIEGLGSQEWKDFIIAAKSYASAISQHIGSRAAYPSDTDTDHCLFCLRPLTEKENNLINNYWNFLQSASQAELNRTIQKLRETEKKLKGLIPVKFDESVTLFNYIYSVNPELASTWKTIVYEIETSRLNIIKNLSDRNCGLPMKAFAVSVKDFNPFTDRIKTEISSLTSKNPANEIGAIDAEIKFLNDKNLFSKLIEQISNFVAAHQWAAKAELALPACKTTSITSKQGELFSAHITKRYIETFNKECELINAPKVDITQRSVKGQTLRRLQVAGLSANKILSEGEQRAISLADFLTEVQLDHNNRGVIFDDPVTSLDHERKELIVTRLVQESVKRQVIIFTHDITFLIALQLKAEQFDIDFSVTTARKSGEYIGIIDPSLPWLAQKVKDRIGFLKSELVKLKKIEKDSSGDNYTYAIKLWYGLLREAWERSIEERLFKGVIERFSPAIQTQRLKKVVITEDMLKDIERGMTETSKWVHDAAAGLSPTIPNTAKAETDLQFFEEFAKKCSAA